MGPETVKAIQDALTPLATKLGEGAAHVYAIYVKQAVANGIGLFIGAGSILLGVIACAIAARICLRIHKKCKDEEVERRLKARNDFFYSRYDSEWGVAGALCLIAIPILLVVAVPMASTATMHLVNPEYYAIQDILCTVKACT